MTGSYAAPYPGPVQFFVTGGSGFLGRHLVTRLVTDGHTVLALARSDAAAESVAEAGARPVRGALHEAPSLAGEVTGTDVVVHAAADTRQWGRPGALQADNVEGTRAVLALAVAVGARRLVHVSTEAVLAGGRPLRYADESAPYPSRHAGEYARTKAVAEQLVLAADGHELRTVCVRPRLIWGPGDTTFAPAVLEAMREGRWAWVSGGDYLTSTCHVRNVVEGIVLAATRPEARGTYFLTDGVPVPFREFVTDVASAYGVDPPARSVPYAVARTMAGVVDRGWRTLRLPGEPAVSESAVALVGHEMTVNDTRARRELGYRPVVDVAAGLTELRAHQEGLPA
jgi:nucleoside-diphosphate-sugar epimerase